jgi:hypothetical protein
MSVVRFGIPPSTSRSSEAVVRYDERKLAIARWAKKPTIVPASKISLPERPNDTSEGKKIDR